MLLLKRLLTSCVLYIVVLFVVLIAVGMVAGAHGGVNRPIGKNSRAYVVGYEASRRYGAIVFLSVLGVPALVAVTISFVGFLPWCKK